MAMSRTLDICYRLDTRDSAAEIYSTIELECDTIYRTNSTEDTSVIMYAKNTYND